MNLAFSNPVRSFCARHLIGHGLSMVSMLLVVFTFVFVPAAAQARALDPISNDEMYKRIAALENSPFRGPANEVPNGDMGSCDRFNLEMKVTDPTTLLDRSMVLDMSRPRTKKPTPVVIIVPTIEGHTVIESTLAKKICGLGIAAIVADVNINEVPDQMPSWGLEDHVNRLGIIALKTIIDYTVTSPHFDPERVGMMGLSLGGITTAMMAGLEPQRLKAVYTVVAGGNLPYIISVSDNARMSELRDRRMKYLGLTTTEQYENELHRTMLFDPLYFSPRAKTQNIFMAMSNNDDKVPSETQQDLFKAFGQPKNTVFSIGHVPSIVALTYFYFSYVGDFFIEQFHMSQDMHLNRSLHQMDEPAPTWAKPPHPYSSESF